MARTLAAAATGGAAVAPALAADVGMDGAQLWRYVMGGDGPDGAPPGFRRALDGPVCQRAVHSARSLLWLASAGGCCHLGDMSGASSAVHLANWMLHRDSPHSWAGSSLPGSPLQVAFRYVMRCAHVVAPAGVSQVAEGDGR